MGVPSLYHSQSTTRWIEELIALSQKIANKKYPYITKPHCKSTSHNRKLRMNQRVSFWTQLHWAVPNQHRIPWLLQCASHYRFPWIARHVQPYRLSCLCSFPHHCESFENTSQIGETTQYLALKKVSVKPITAAQSWSTCWIRTCLCWSKKLLTQALLLAVRPLHALEAYVAVLTVPRRNNFKLATERHHGATTSDLRLVEIQGGHASLHVAMQKAKCPEWSSKKTVQHAKQLRLDSIRAT